MNHRYTKLYMTVAAQPIAETDSERRITVRLLSYWERMRKGRPMPAEADINPEDIEDLWANCFLVRVADLKKPHYTYSYLGEAIAQAYHGGLSEADEGRVLSPHPEKLAHCYQQVIRDARPMMDEGEFPSRNNTIVKYRQCLLPLGEAGQVAAIFGGMRFRVFPPE